MDSSAKSYLFKTKTVAVVGSGISGLACARILKDAGASVTIFEKNAVVGGRAATRIVGVDSFDHGAQYFTARSDRFRKQIIRWLEAGVIAQWQGRVGSITDGRILAEKNSHERFVGAPYMRSIPEHMACEMPVVKNNHVNGLSKNDKRWRLTFADGHATSGFDAVVIAIPASQAAALIEPLLDQNSLLQKCQAVTLTPCWSTMVSFAEKLNLEFDGLFVNQSDLSWICRDSSKPGRTTGERFVLHASPSWTMNHLADEQNAVSQNLISKFFKLTGCRKQAINASFSKLWRYAAPVEIDSNAEPSEPLVTSDGLAVCGDWCYGSRVEGAFLSGQFTAEKLLRLFATANGDQLAQTG